MSRSTCIPLYQQQTGNKLKLATILLLIYKKHVAGVNAALGLETRVRVGVRSGGVSYALY